MTAVPIQISLGLTSHHNQSLFSDHYLDDILRRSDDWQRALAPAREFLAWLRRLYAQEKAQLPHYNEAQLEDNWFKPIFNRLGHVWEGQPSVPGWQRAIKKPDYVFFPDEAARQTAVAQQNSPAYAALALAVGEVKQWGVNLSKKTGAQPIFADQNPMYQIDTYLNVTGLAWGVLSNGRTWRLLHKSSSRTLETYFEIDLLAALEQPDETKATAVAAYFWLFFRQAAFRPDERGRIFLNDALEQSRAYALALEADLRDNAYRALEQLILGFFAANAALDAADPAHRAAVYRHSLYLLYRLLFLFYGESRALLPMNNEFYRQEYSLQQLARQIDGRRGQMDKLPATGRRYWHRLNELFRLIGGADPQLNADVGVSRYNGGLFDPAQHPFLETHAVGDRFLAQAIDYLAYRRVRENGRFRGYQAVDYRTLDVRQLGSIYEGLLEYKVAIAAEEMVTVRQKGVEVWLPARSRGRAKPLARRAPGELYLATDKGERKATGSYYTPDYVVEYIVENTLGPLVDRARERAAQAGGGAERFIAEILALNVLDPAMGSGHFLVEATHYLARALATDARTQAADDDQTAVASPAEDDLLYWKRRVVEACIYGVDKNPMAVELAKLSLWLKTAAADKPLSFLDHHLQCGDSLVGAWLDDLRAAPGRQPQTPASNRQAALFDESAFTRDAGLAVGGVMAIERATTDTIADVHLKERLWQELQEKHVGRWRRLADLWVSYWFGNRFTPEEYRALAAWLSGRADDPGDWAETFLNHPAAAENDYFHWELAFPELFFDEYGRSLKEAAGFDAVIGNPPYVRQETLSASKTFLRNNYVTYHSAADLYVYFMELGTRMLKQSASSCFIVSHKFMRSAYGLALRKFLTRRAELQQVVHFSDLPIFGAISAYPAIVCWRKRKPVDSLLQVFVAQFTDMGFEADLAAAVKQAGYWVSQIGLKDSGWTLRNGKITELQQKITRHSRPLHDYVNNEIHYGIKTGFNKAFFIDQTVRERILQADPQTRSLLKPLVTGEDVQRYAVYHRKQFMIVIPAGWTKTESGLADETSAWNWLQQTYPALSRHLAQFAEQAKKRRDMGDFWWELRPCAYYAAFESPKIIYPVIAKDLRFALDKEGFYSNDKTFIIAKEDAYLLALLNASLTGFFARFALSGLRGDYLEFRAAHFQKLPIYNIAFSTPENERMTAVAAAKTHYTQDDHPALLAWTEAELAANRNDTIHDLLAFLAEQMIEMNREKQAKLEAFWLDLEGVTGAKTFAALRKGKQEASLHKAAPAARPFVSSASRGRVTLDAALAWNEEAFKEFVKLLGPKKVDNFSGIVQLYRRHSPALAPLRRRLAATDRLIDQVVYRLYHLTPEEIALVEGRPGSPGAI